MMRERQVHWWPLLLALAALIATAADAPAEQTKTEVLPVDLVQYNGTQNSVAVYLVNLTPYTIDYAWSSMGTGTSTMSRDRSLKKSFMFAPVGAPSGIPGLKQDNNGDYVYDSTAHLYPMVFSWDDRAGMIEDNSITWTVKDVCYKDYTGPADQCADKADVQVGLFFTRQDPKPDLKSELFALTADLVKFGLEAAALVETGGTSELAWVTTILATKELASGADEFAKENVGPDYGPRIYVSAMPWPTDDNGEVKSISTGRAPGYESLTDTDPPPAPDDGVVVEWGSDIGGEAPAKLLVSTQLQRGLMPGRDAYIGTMPIARVVVWEEALYKAAKAKYNCEQFPENCPTELRMQLHRWDRTVRQDLVRLFRSLGAKEREAYTHTLQAMASRHPLTAEQKEQLDLLGVALKEHRTSLKPERPPMKGGAHDH
jgi:hypothetical protein